MAADRHLLFALLALQASHVRHCNPQIQSCVSVSCCVPKFVSYGLVLTFQKNPERESVGDQQ